MATQGNQRATQSKRKRATAGGGGGAATAAVPTHMKYPTYDADAAMSAALGRTKPSALLQELTQGPPKALKFAPPKIIEFLDLRRNTAQIHSTVDVDQPLFQPFPLELAFDDYKPFGIHTKTLYFRNNDSVARRIKILSPESPYFEVSAPRSARSTQPLLDGKVAAGMEVCYVVTFKPQERREYALELVCSTEREKFVVPITAPGTMAALNFPDDLDFGVCPVKSTSAKSLVVRNVGTRASKFLFTATTPYAIEPADVFVDVGSSAQVEVTFVPEESGEYEGEVRIEDEAGKQSFMRVTGRAENVNVYLAEPSVEPDPAYISLSSRKTIKIYNRSEFPAKFSWTAFATPQEEWEERARLGEELARMEELEQENLANMEFSDAGSDDSLSDDEGVPPAMRVEQAVLRRKYQNLRKAVEEDRMTFVDENFQLEPTTGEIWANSEIEVTVTFRPQTAAEYDCVAFLDVQGRDTRLPLQLLGKGIGPKATLSYDVLDIGDVFVNSVHKYEITLQNCGDIECTYELQPCNTPFGPKFQFEPSSGLLKVGDAHIVTVTFCSDILGEFSEHFNFKLQGSDEPLSVHFKGHVVGPTFHFDVEELNYGIVSYDFLSTKTLALMNTSEIPMNFALRVPQDGTLLKKEFVIEPQKGTIEPGGRQVIAVDFTSQTVKVYDYYLTVDVEGVGEGLLSLPISAECQVPDVIVEKDNIEFGECFMRYPYQQTLTLVNESDLYAKYEVVEQDEYSQAVASYNADAFKGTIPPFGRHDIGMTMVCEKLGKIRLPLNIKIAGSKDLPLLATVSALGKGPNVVLSADALKWGNKKCLFDHPKTLTMHNDSLIPAQFRAFVKGTRSKFRISPRQGTMQPGEKVDIAVVGHFDDITAFKDVVQISIHEGQSLLVPLTAKGVGTTMFCEDDISTVDFGYQLTNKVCERKFFLENRGRRTQTLTWINKTLIEKFAKAKAKERAAEEKAKKSGKKSKKKPIAVEPTFTVVPESIELRPRTGCEFTFRGTWKEQADIEELLVLEAKVGKESLNAFECNVKGNFINPLLQPSAPALNFNYTYKPDEELVVQTQTLTLTNVSELPLTFDLVAKTPFIIDTQGATLQPTESITVTVEFDPGYRDDRQSHDINTAIFCTYADHPQKDRFPLLAEINFPNLEFEYTDVKFGCILNDTTKSLMTTIKNCSRVPTALQWAFIESEQLGASKKKKPHIPINQVFDILPIRSYLQPGESEQVEFVYYGHADRKFRGQVVVEVEGGPEYELALSGEASVMNQNLDVTYLDFGDQDYATTMDRDFKIINTGKVSFPFHIRLDKLARQGVVTVHPLSGRVHAGDSQKINVKFRPGIPHRIRELLVVELGHFAPVTFPIIGRGIYATVASSLPRLELPAKPQWVTGDEEYDEVVWENLIEAARTEMMAEKQQADATKLATKLIDQALENGTCTAERGAGLAAQVASAAEVSDELLQKLEDELGMLVMPNGSSRPVSRMTNGGLGDTFGGTRIGSAQTLTGRPGSPTRTEMTAMTAKTSATNTLAMKNQTVIDVEKNAERIYLREHLLQLERKALETAALTELLTLEEGDEGDEDGGVAGADVPPLALGDDATPPGTAASAPAPPTASSGGSKARGRKGKKGKKKEDPFVLTHFLCDMKEVVHLSTKTKKFRLQNAGHLPISFALDKKAAEACGFTLDPEKVVRLPESETLDFEIVFDANEEIPFGPVEVALPLSMKNGPKVVLVLRANVTVPDVVLSHHHLAFGDVLVGRSNTTYVQLHNPSPVPAEWAFKKPLGSTKDLANFITTPQSGTLQPNERINVSVEFEPKEMRNYAIRIPIKVVNNTHSKETLRLDGMGQELSLAFTPSLTEFGPVLPYETVAPYDFAAKRAAVAEATAAREAAIAGIEGLDEMEPEAADAAIAAALEGVDLSALEPDTQVVHVAMTNKSAHPVDVYSLDFDEVYLAEEKLLRQADGCFDENEVMRCPLRMPGDPLPEEVLAIEAKRIAMEAATAAKDAAIAGIEGLDEMEPEAADAAIAAALEGVDLSALEPEPEIEPPPPPTDRERGEAHDYVVTGPPLSGKTTVAHLLADDKVAAYGEAVGQATLDSIVADALALARSEDDAGVLGAEVRAALGQQTEEDTVAEAAAAEAVEAAEAAHGGKKPPAKHAPPADEEEAGPKFLGRALLTRVLEWRLAQRDFGSGVVIDDIACKYVASPTDAAAALGAALGKDQSWPAELILLKPGEDAYSDLLGRIGHHVEVLLEQAKPDIPPAAADGADEAEAAPAFAELSEEDFAALNEEAQAVYAAAKESAAAEAEAAEAEAAARAAALAEAEVLQARLAAVRTERKELGLEASPAGEAEEAAPALEEAAPAAEAEAEGEEGEADGEEAVEEAPKVTAYEGALVAVLEKWRVPEEPPSFEPKSEEELAELNEEARTAYDAELAAFEAGEAEKAAAAAAEAAADGAAEDAAAAEGVLALADAAEPEEPEEASADQNLVVEVSFHHGERQHRVYRHVVHHMPSEEREEEEFILPIPEPETHFLVARPQEREQRTTTGGRYRIVVPDPPPPPEPTEEEAAAAAAASVDAGEPAEELVVAGPPARRWVLQPGESANFDVVFESTDVGIFDCALAFEAVGGTQEFNLMLQGVCAVPTLNTDPRNVFMNRIKQRPDHINVSKKYVINRELFEFGPLLVNKDAGLRLDEGEKGVAAAVTNAETFRISNSGRTKMHVDFVFQTQADAAPTFFAEPQSLDLEEGETKSVVVWAFPSEPRLYSDSLVCCIEDNPDPERFPITCLGSDPLLDVGGPWQEAASAALAAAELMDEEDAERAGALAAAQALAELPPTLDFDRLLLQRSEDREVLLTNTCTVPVKWWLELGETMEGLVEQEFFDVSPREGELMPGQSGALLVNFRAISSAVHETDFKIKFSDTEDVDATVIKEVGVAVKAEAYEIAICSFEQADGSPGSGELDFGIIRVGEAAVQKFTVVNQGKYDVKYAFNIRKALARELFTVEPPEGVIEPGQKGEIAVTFRSQREIELVGNKDIRCTVMEARSGEEYVEASFGCTASARAVFSKFRLNPNKGINFGASKFNDAPVVKYLELRNESELFDYTFSLTSASEERPSMTAFDAEGKMIVPNVNTGSVDIGQFTFNPAGGTIGPKLVTRVEATFRPNGHEVFREMVDVNISGRDEEDAADSLALQYEVVGESCFPGINTSDFDDLFEEQAVIPRLEPGEEVPGAHFVENEQRFDFGNIVPSSYPKGVPERFKIANLQKVPCTVNFAIDTEEAEGVFSVQPSSWVIPSHEHRYVTVYFKPSAMQRYKGRFSATVEDGADTDSSKLEFEVGGQGTMPCITVEQPAEKDDDGNCVVDFGRVQQHKRKDHPIVLKNNGLVPATVLFSLPSSNDFSVNGASSSVELARGESVELNAAFHPQQPHEKEGASCKLKVNVQHNRWDDYTFKLVGQGFYADLTFENLPPREEGGVAVEGADELFFKDLDLASGEPQKRQAVFTIQSCSKTPLRFQWDEAESLSFSPSCGHLHPGAKKRIFATFSSETAVVLEQKAVALNFQKIAFSEAAEPADWDDRMMVVRYLSEEELVSRQAEAADGADGDGADGDGAAPSAPPVADNGGDPYKVREVAPEPENAPLEGEEPQKAELKCTAIADTIAFECDTQSVAFRNTSMFQTRLHTFTVKNTSRAKLEYDFEFTSMGAEATMRPGTAANPKNAAPLPNPYVLEPAAGVIAAGESQSFTLSFTPLEVDDFKYRLQANILGLPVDATPLALFLRGRSTRPVCHFELPESDYLQRRPAGLPGPTGELGALDPNVHVVEFESLGTRVRNTKRFHVMNPQNVSYEFSWTAVGTPNAAFRCAAPAGNMLPGRRSEMIFEFTPDTVGVSEAFYRLTIPSQGVNELFLLTGSVTDPRIYLNRNRCDFGAHLTGGHATEVVYLVNKEHIPFHFNFDRTSFDFGSRTRPQIALNPSSGTVPPEGRTAIEVTFTPTEEKAQNYNIPCVVKRKATKLSLNIKGEGYAIHPRLELLEEGEQPTDLTSKRGELNYLDLGQLHTGEKTTRTVMIHNSGKFNFEYDWRALRARNPMLTITPEVGMVPKGDKQACTLLFNPVEDVEIVDYRLACTVAESQRFPLAISARAVRYAVAFSFENHDFGACFVGAPGAPPQSHTVLLSITNQELDEDVSIDCRYENSPEFEVDCRPALLSVGEMVQVPVTFRPRDLTSYRVVVPFVINGTGTVNVVLTGQGAMAKVELANPMMQQVGFGTLQVGQESSRRVTIVNRAERAAEFELVDPVVAGRGSLEQRGISFFPTGPVPLRPRESMEVELTFAPEARVPAFAEELHIAVAGTTRKLCTVTGVAQGMQVTLDTDTLPFGPVCERSHVTRHIQMENTGDMVTKFQWDERAFAPDFSISPVEGVLGPFSGQKFEVTFHPDRIDDDIRYENIPCFLQGADQVPLTLTGACIAQPDSDVKQLTFAAPARSEDAQKVSISNPTEKPWTLVPVLEGENWRRGTETVEVPPKGSADFEIVYHPLTMSAAVEAAGGEPHTGSLFIALPNGNALLYELGGAAAEPAPEEAIEREVEAKVPITIALPVRNWLKVPQRFSVAVEPEGGWEGDVADSTSWEIADKIDVPQLQERSLPLKFISHKDGPRAAKVTLLNEDNGEYLTYNIAMTVGPPPLLRTIELDTTARQLATKTITIANPLRCAKKVTLEGDGGWWTCANPRVRVRQLGDMSGSAEGAFEVAYRPLVPADEEADLQIAIPELGVFNYKLKLVATSAGMDRALDFKAPLGGTIQREFRFRNYASSNTTFQCSVGKPEFFSVAATAAGEATDGWEGKDVVVSVSFEPSALGVTADVLTLTSADAGEYSCRLAAVPKQLPPPQMARGMQHIAACEVQGRLVAEMKAVGGQILV